MDFYKYEKYLKWCKEFIAQYNEVNPEDSKSDCRDELMKKLKRMEPWTDGELEEWWDIVTELLDNYYD